MVWRYIYGFNRLIPTKLFQLQDANSLLIYLHRYQLSSCTLKSFESRPESRCFHNDYITGFNQYLSAQVQRHLASPGDANLINAETYSPIHGQHRRNSSPQPLLSPFIGIPQHPPSRLLLKNPFICPSQLIQWRQLNIR
ncbi:hypothetical protein D3C71_1519050 [compost metagenome]